MKQIRQQQLAGAMLSESRFEPGVRLDSHSHTNPYFIVVLQGRYVESRRASDVEHRAGSVCFYPRREEHSVLIGREDVNYLTIDLPDAPPRSVQMQDHGPLLWLAARVVREFRHGALSAALLAQMIRAMDTPLISKEPRWFRDVDAALRAEFDSKLTALSLAQRMGMHPVHLSRMWRRHRGQSVTASLHRLRVDSAIRLMIDRRMPLADVAAEVGFADQPQLTRAFKRFTGLTPGAFKACFTADPSPR